MIHKKLLEILVLGFCTSMTLAQQWRTVTSFVTFKDVDVSGEQTWVATSGGILRFDVGTFEEEKFTNTEGLFSNTATSVASDSSRRQIVVAHLDGTLQLFDLLSHEFTNLYDLRGMAITDLVVHGDMLLVASMQGMAVLDLEQRTVIGSVTKFGDLPTNSPVLRIGADASSYWCATAGAVVRASRSGNFQVPGSWTVYDGDHALGSASIRDMLVLRDSLYVLTSDRGMLLYDSDMDSFLTHTNGLTGTDLQIGTLRGELICYGFRTLFFRSGSDWQNSGMSFVDSDGQDFSNLFLLKTASGRLVSLDGTGVIRHRSGEGPWTSHRVNSPYSNFFSGLRFDSNTKMLWTASTRGYDCCGGGPGFSGFNTRTGQWLNFNKNTLPSIPFAYFYNVETDNSGNVWLGSWGRGAIIFNPLDSSISRLDGSNGLAFLEVECPGTTLVNEVFFDRQGKAWISVQKPCDLSRAICVYDPISGELTYHSSTSVGTNTPGEMMEDQFGRVWATSFPVDDQGVGMMVYSREAGRWDRLDRNDYPNLVSNNTTAVAEDEDGNIWIGTTDGLQTYSPFSDEVSLTYRYPDGPVNELINDIAVDRFNNKWIGTSGGLSVLSNNGEWLHFTKENSNLVGNNIASIAFNDSTGEVYIGTFDEGLSVLKHPIAQINPVSSVRVYPNPFVPDDNVGLKFSGVPSQSIVKLYTISGELVKTIQVTTSTQQVSWDGRDYKGRYVSSGVYLYHIYPSTASATRYTPKTGKVAVIRR